MMQLEQLVAKQLSDIMPDYKFKKYLLAVSGGSDSICLLHVFSALKLNFELAHCNFHLRGEESNGDEAFVRFTAERLAVKSHYIEFNTTALAAQHKVSIQEEARTLRYDWFKELADNKKFDYIVTAHHQDDLIETFFINSVRGSGIKGLRSIPLLTENVLRPLLNIPKEEITNYISTNKLTYRDDSSNDNLHYSRNYLRHKIIPSLENVHQNAKKGIVKSIDNLIRTEQYLEQKLQEDRKKYVEETKEGINIMLHDSVSAFFLFDAVSTFGFNQTQLNDVLNSKQKGSQFFSSTHLMFKEDDCLRIVAQPKEAQSSYKIPGVGAYEAPFAFSITEEECTEKLEFNSSTAYFDAGKIDFPLVLRKWQAGDTFIPFGMKGQKKLSDFFIDSKLSRFEKEQVWILENKGRICWIVGKRMDNRFKISRKTSKIIKIVTY